ncbi:hypothetical protein EDL99_03765 [Ornithobacterium rhinotracheale]|uniref:hypothetical protein n=1 Tax=Ornithobacterium rhinotracheale TaxID=28251 RepID=UPI00129D0A9A|nr:hypothetical protein [Ornithobacterium rhinotracheale]MRJ08006.1 hypothetical protein [Ornithobacterium rhinotracheale]UOH78486.1 hypothetical protein MT996_03225 [Ornithobacterium rhinotracheale]
MKNKILLLALFVIQQINAQVLITETISDENVAPHPSAQLEIRHDKKGVYLPQVALDNARDVVNVKTPREGTLVFNTTKGLPESKYEGVAVWDGEKWLFSNNEDDLSKVIDVVQTRSYDGRPNVKINRFPDENPSFKKGDKFSNQWTILAENNTDTYFKYDSDKGVQKLIIDAEGLAAIDNYREASSLAYAVGIFVDNKLITVRKFKKESVSGLCTYHKFNIRGVLDSPEYFTKKANYAYNIKLAAIPLIRITSNYNEITFGGVATGCHNLNEDTAKTYMNVLRIERER